MTKKDDPFEEMMNLVNAGDKLIRELMAQPKQKPRRGALQQALQSSDPLGQISDIIDDGVEPGKTFRWAYTCILEVNSARLFILFDRYEDDELDEMEAALETIGATDTLNDLRTLRHALNEAVAAGQDRFDAALAMEEQPALEEIAERFEEHVAEMEEKLLAYTTPRLNEFAADE